jgi:hypothetical protein
VFVRRACPPCPGCLSRSVPMLGSKIPSWFGAARCSVPMSSSHRPTGASVAPPTPRAAWSGGRLCGGAGVCSAGGSTGRFTGERPAISLGARCIRLGLSWSGLHPRHRRCGASPADQLTSGREDRVLHIAFVDHAAYSRQANDQPGSQATADDSSGSRSAAALPSTQGCPRAWPVTCECAPGNGLSARARLPSGSLQRLSHQVPQKAALGLSSLGAVEILNFLIAVR